MPHHRNVFIKGLRISVAWLAIAFFVAPHARGDEVSAPGDIVRAIVEADVAGESLGRAMSKLRKLEEPQQLEAVALLVDASRSNLERARINAIKGLVQLGSTASSAGDRLIEMLHNPQETPMVRALAADALGRIADGSIAAPALVDVLQEREKLVRQQAAFALADLPPKALAPVSAKLVAAMGDSESEIRAALAKSAGRAGAGGATDVLDPLIKLTDDSDGAVRLAAIEAIGQLHESAAPAVEKLTTILQNSDRAILRATALTIAQIGEPAQSALGPMMQAGDRADIRAAIALLKYRIGQTGMGLAELKDAATHAAPDWSVAVAEIGAPCVPMLEQLLDSKRTAPLAIEALQKLGPGAKDALGALRRVQSSSDVALRAQATAAIQLIDQ
jgi:HEAT repeat protein